MEICTTLSVSTRGAPPGLNPHALLLALPFSRRMLVRPPHHVPQLRVREALQMGGVHGGEVHALFSREHEILYGARPSEQARPLRADDYLLLRARGHQGDAPRPVGASRQVGDGRVRDRMEDGHRDGDVRSRPANGRFLPQLRYRVPRTVVHAAGTARRDHPRGTPRVTRR